jgi:hypothetical protein
MHGPDSDPDSPSRLAQDPLLAEAAALRAKPQFPAVVREFADVMARFRESVKIFNKLIANENRFRTLRYLLYLDSERKLLGEDGGASYSQLLELCTRRHEVSPRVLKTTLALLTLTGFVRTRRGNTDSRQKFYYPTEALFDYVRLRLTRSARLLDLLEPAMERARMLQEDPNAVRRVLASSGRSQTLGEPPADRMPDFMAFYGAQEGAAPLVFTMILADYDGVPVPSRAAIARRFGLSKTQVTNLIAEAARLGYVTIDDKGVPATTPALRASFARWVSIELAYQSRHIR